MKRSTASEVTCLACLDVCQGVILTSLVPALEAGGPGHIDLCIDCVVDMFNATKTKVSEVVKPSVQMVIGEDNQVKPTNAHSYSDPDLSGSSSLPGLGADPERARVRGPSVKYPAEFERLWAGCTGRKGNKHPAFKAFNLVKPDVDQAITKWLSWMQTDGWKRGYSQYLATWINARGFNDDPDPSEFKPNGHGGAGAQVGHHRAEVKPRPSGEVKL